MDRFDGNYEARLRAIADYECDADVLMSRAHRASRESDTDMARECEAGAELLYAAADELRHDVQ